MRTRPLSARLLLLALLGRAAHSSRFGPKCRTRSGSYRLAQAAAWNKHDADAYAALFHVRR